MDGLTKGIVKKRFYLTFLQTICVVEIVKRFTFQFCLQKICYYLFNRHQLEEQEEQKLRIKLGK